ncbi:PREDICTED: uncharacterized protein LOC109114699 [Nelumbo nucifera]|uniref:Uncharacterized protein n=2 Tax=Nelumbo nucifera TaxID=4432 RepID=A0A822Y2X1_NELNU|nr:PREDICTED: uncharacterized protein LOC109114699 [Nelumbo nucifera]DAD26323.1 TPA_asm: hypothetical protein HUJ06_027791 [Nelumbo nucifera]
MEPEEEKGTSTSEAKGELGEEVEKEEQRKGDDGRFINQLLSNLPKTREIDHDKVCFGEVKDEGKEEKDGTKHDVKVESGGGLVNNLISTFLHKSETGTEENENKKEVGKLEEAESTGLINNFISNLPSLPDDHVPATDEASILIHSIIHD